MLPRIVQVLGPVRPLLLRGELISLLLDHRRVPAGIGLRQRRELTAAAGEVGVLDEAAEVGGAVTPGVDAEHGLALVAHHAHPLVAALLLLLHLRQKRNRGTEPDQLE